MSQPVLDELASVAKAVAAGNPTEPAILMRVMKQDVSGANAVVLVAIDPGDGSRLPAMIAHAFEALTAAIPKKKKG